MQGSNLWGFRRKEYSREKIFERVPKSLRGFWKMRDWPKGTDDAYQCKCNELRGLDERDVWARQKPLEKQKGTLRSLGGA